MNSRTALLILGILILPALAFARPQVAVLDTVVAAGMDKTVAAPVTDKLIEELVNSGRFTVIDRANVEQVLREKEFQLSSGVVGTEEVRRAGEYLGADLVLVANASRVGSTYVISAKMIDVVTGEIVAQASSEQKGTIDVVLDVARTVGRQISGQRVAAESRAQELVREEQGRAAPAAPAPAPAPAAPAAPAAPVAAPAAAPAGNPLAALQMQSLIRGKAHLRRSGQRQMMILADELSVSERILLYSTNRKYNAPLILALNLVPSLGSWVQGDRSGAVVELSLMTVGLLGMSTGETYDWYYGTERNALYWAGALTFSLYFVYSCVRPFNYQRTWNARLARGLKTVNLSVLDPGGMSFDLTRTPQGSEWAMGLSLVSFEY